MKKCLLIGLFCLISFVSANAFEIQTMQPMNENQFGPNRYMTKLYYDYGSYMTIDSVSLVHDLSHGLMISIEIPKSNLGYVWEIDSKRIPEKVDEYQTAIPNSKFILQNFLIKPDIFQYTNNPRELVIENVKRDWDRLQLPNTNYSWQTIRINLTITQVTP